MTLTPEEVRRIRKHAQEGHTASAIGRAYGVNAETIRRILRRETWAWLSDEGPAVRPTRSVEKLDLPELTPELKQRADESAKRLLEQLEKKDQQ